MISKKIILALVTSISLLFCNADVSAQSNRSVEAGTKILNGSKGLKLHMAQKPSKPIDPLVGNWQPMKMHLIRGKEGRTSFAHDSLEIKHIRDNQYAIKKYSIFPDGTNHEHDTTEYIFKDGVFTGLGSKLKYSGPSTSYISNDQVVSELGNKLIYTENDGTHGRLDDVDSGIQYGK